MGSTHKIVSVLLRCIELICACIVVGILGYFLHQVDRAGHSADGRLVYTVVTAALSIAFSLCLMPPLKYSFWGFPLDIIMFIMWIVAFALLEHMVSGDACGASWYYNYWSFYWGGFWRRPGLSAFSVACGEWRAVLGFSFISFFLWLLSSGLGAYAALTYRDENRGTNGNGVKMPWSKKEPETQTDVQQPMTDA